MTNNNGKKSLCDRVRDQTVTAGRGGAGGGFEVSDADAFPLLTDLLANRPEGHKGAKLGRLGFFVQDGLLTCCLSYPSLGVVAFWPCRSFQDAFCEVEKALDGCDVQWRKDRSK